MPCSGPRTRPGSPLAIARVRLVERARVDGEHRVQAVLVAGDARQRLLHDLARRGAAAASIAARMSAMRRLDDGERARLGGPLAAPSGADCAARRAPPVSGGRERRQGESACLRIFGCGRGLHGRDRDVAQCSSPAPRPESARRSPTCSRRSGFDLVLTARREDRLRAVAARLERAARGARATSSSATCRSRDAAAALCDEIAAPRPGHRRAGEQRRLRRARGVYIGVAVGAARGDAAGDGDRAWPS